jgi:hypothetical protein
MVPSQLEFCFIVAVVLQFFRSVYTATIVENFLQSIGTSDTTLFTRRAPYFHIIHKTLNLLF